MPISNSFLQTLYHDSREEMRWKSEIEHKLTSLMITLYTIITAAIAGVNRFIKDQRLSQILTVILILLLLTATYYVTKKITSEHLVYERIGETVIKVWRFFRLFDKGVYLKDDAILDERAKNFGKGQGYRETERILWVMTLIIIVFSLILLFTA